MFYIKFAILQKKKLKYPALPGGGIIMIKKLSLALMACALLLLAVACTDSLVPKEYEKNISEIRETVYEATENAATVTIFTGEREDPYSIDGISNKRANYTIINFKPAVVSGTKQYKYKLTDGSDVYSGDFTIHPFGTMYSAELSKKLKNATVALEVSENEVKQNFAPVSKLTGDMITWDKAILIAKDILTDQIATMMDGKTLKGEIFVRFICDPMNSNDKHFWYVGFSDSEKTFAVLIDPVTQEILAVKK